MSKPSFGQLLTRSLLAGATSTALNVGVAKVGTRLFKTPETFAPYTLLPIASGSVVGSLGAGSVYAVLAQTNKQPTNAFRLASLLVLLASYYLPTRLFTTKSPRFAGANLPVILSLMVMHTVVALVSTIFFTRQTDKN